MENVIMPEHIAIIMDGNRRWAKKRLLSVAAGHKAGAQTLRKLVEAADLRGLKYLTVYAFSTENWTRDKAEVKNLMNLIRAFVKEYIEDTDKNNIRMRVIGDISQFEADIREKIAFLEESTKAKTGLTVILALNYGGRDEISRVCLAVCNDVLKGIINKSDINEETLKKYMDTKDFPDPELIIRTAGEKRLSNFLLWQSAYSEFYFDDALWPDYNIQKLEEAVRDFNKRGRRFGGR
ncbi:MAG: isoprenyl transferase [Clostridiales bacterium]|nr:isoprenyl transferase [Clostridiales bacterium]